MIYYEVADTLNLVQYIGKLVLKTRHIIVWCNRHARERDLVGVQHWDFLINEGDWVGIAQFLKLWLQLTGIPVLMGNHNYAEADHDSQEKSDTTDVRPYIHWLVVTCEQALAESSNWVMIDSVTALDVLVIHMEVLCFLFWSNVRLYFLR